MPGRNPQFDNWKAVCSKDAASAEMFYERAKKIAKYDLPHLSKMLKYNGKEELAEKIAELAPNIIEAALPADRIEDASRWSESRKKVNELFTLLRDNVEDISRVIHHHSDLIETGSKVSVLGDSIYHFSGEMAARGKFPVDMDETYREYIRNKNSYIDRIVSNGRQTVLEKTDEQYSVYSEYANKTFHKNLMLLREGFDEKGILGSSDSLQEHQAFVKQVKALTEASENIINAPYGDKEALDNKEKALGDTKKAAENYVAAKRAEAHRAPDDEEWRPRNSAERKHYEAALNVIIGINDEIERLNAPETPDPVYEGELPDESPEVEMPFSKFTWISRLADIPEEEPDAPDAREAFLNEYKRCKLAIEIVDNAKELPEEEKTPEKFNQLLKNALSDEEKIAELDAQLGDNVWENMTKDRNKVSNDFYMVEMMSFLNAPQKRAAERNGDEAVKDRTEEAAENINEEIKEITADTAAGETPTAAEPQIDNTEHIRDLMKGDCKTLDDISKDLNDRGLLGMRGSSAEHSTLLNAVEELRKATEARAVSQESYEDERQKHLDALIKAKKAAESYIAEKKKNGWGDTSASDWQPLSPMGRTRYKAAQKILDFVETEINTIEQELSEKENITPAPEQDKMDNERSGSYIEENERTESFAGGKDIEEERTDSFDSSQDITDDVSEINANESNDIETDTLDNNITDIEGKNEMIEEAGDKLEGNVSFKQEGAPGSISNEKPEKKSDPSNTHADLNKKTYLDQLSAAAEKMNAPKADWEASKADVMTNVACVLFINKLETACKKKGEPMPNMSQQDFNELVSKDMSDPAFERTFTDFGGTSFGALNRVQTNVLKDGGKDFHARFSNHQLDISRRNSMNEKIKDNFKKNMELTKTKKNEFIMH